MKASNQNEIITITMTRGQAECLLKHFESVRPKGNRGREFAVWRAIKKALGTWENNKSSSES